MITKKYNDEAISPVIGVMIMITITVLMSITIAMFMDNISNKQYVPCSDFHKITDKYKTPNRFYVIFEGISTPNQISYNEFKEWKIGQYVNLLYRKPINLIEVSEFISGYKDACMEIP
jgi:hypothetical protein